MTKSEEFKDVVKIAKVEWCGLMNGTGVNGFLQIWINLFKNAVPNLFHACPYPRGNHVINATLKEDIFPVFPIGQYIVFYNISSSRKQLFSIQYELESFQR
jgi:Protein of unknown function (DUF1091)